MKVHELSKKLGVSNKELLEELGLKSHLSVVPEDVLAKYEAAEPVVEAEPTEEIPDVDLIRRSINGLGNKSPYWKYREYA